MIPTGRRGATIGTPASGDSRAVVELHPLRGASGFDDLISFGIPTGLS